MPDYPCPDAADRHTNAIGHATVSRRRLIIPCSLATPPGALLFMHQDTLRCLLMIEAQPHLQKVKKIHA
jgi:hypothetical protein